MDCRVRRRRRVSIQARPWSGSRNPGKSVVGRLALAATALALAWMPDARAGEARTGSSFSERLDEIAVAADLTGTGRDAVLMRGEGGQGFLGFVPDGEASHQLRVLLAPGSDVAEFAVEDSDADGIADLVVSHQDGGVSLWTGNGLGDFLAPEMAMHYAWEGMRSLAGAGVAPRAAAVAMPTGTGEVSGGEAPTSETGVPSIQGTGPAGSYPVVQAQDAGPAPAVRVTDPAERRRLALILDRARWSRPEIRSAALRAAGLRSPARADLDGDGYPELVALAPGGRVVEIEEDGARFHEVLSLPAGFAARLLVAGRFLADGGAGLAVVERGPRPRLLLIEAVNDDARGSHVGWYGFSSGRSRLQEDAGWRETGTATGQDREHEGWERSLTLGRSGATVNSGASPSAIFTVNVASSGLTFSPSSVTIQAGDTVRWVWVGSFHTVTSGNPCTPDNLFCSPSNTSCATAPTSNSGAVYERVFPAPGNFPYFCRPHCVSGMTGTVVVNAPGPGVIPNGSSVPGTPLRLAKAAGGNVNLTWSASCSTAASNYGVYEGSLSIAGTYSHHPVSCNLGNVTATSLAPSAGNRYYLVVPQTASQEGSYGRRGSGTERPQGTPACKPQLLSPCP